MDKKYKIANTNILVTGELEIADGVATPLFETDFEEPDFVISVTESDCFVEGVVSYESKKIRVAYVDERRYITYFNSYTGEEFIQLVYSRGSNIICAMIKSGCVSWAANMNYLLPMLNLRSILLKGGTLIMRAAYVEHNDRAILFSAPSGSGKTTQADMWRSLYSARIINGDRAALRVRKDAVMAYGLPVSGTSSVALNETHKVSAIVSLSQSAENEVARLSGDEAFNALIKDAVFNRWDESDSLRAAEIARDICASVPVFSFACLPDKTSAAILKNTLALGKWHI